MKLRELLHRSGIEPVASFGDVEVASISMDSRSVSAGALFVCMPGKNTDARRFILNAAENGAVAAMVYDAEGAERAGSAGLAVFEVSNDGINYYDAVWRVCREFYESPTREMRVVGVTGTNGKTTTAWLIRDMLAALGVPSAYLGTLGFQIPGEDRELSNTTPFSVELYRLLDEARAKSVKALAIEVSSHALSERRADGVEFDAAVFTNLTQDHLDYHGTMEEYALAKWRLFADLPNQTSKRFVAAFNIDDPTGAEWAQRHAGPKIKFGLGAGADLKGVKLSVAVDRIRMRLEYGESIEVSVPLGGNFNVFNCLSAAAGLLALGFELGDLETALPAVRPVPGRFEAVPNDRQIGILVDYAHTPDALVKLLDSVRELQPKRIITVFGCGGDRDATKRPKMARAASERSDITVVTSDNPRTEDPESILRQVESGILPGRECLAIIDRREAIAHAVTKAEPGDVVVIAGKGHENYQIIGRTKYPMDDRELAREALK